MILFVRVFSIWLQEQPFAYRLFLGVLFLLAVYAVFRA